jgi:hypothetical protein
VAGYVTILSLNLNHKNNENYEFMMKTTLGLDPRFNYQNGGKKVYTMINILEKGDQKMVKINPIVFSY